MTTDQNKGGNVAYHNNCATRSSKPMPAPKRVWLFAGAGASFKGNDRVLTRDTHDKKTRNQTDPDQSHAPHGSSHLDTVTTQFAVSHNFRQQQARPIHEQDPHTGFLLRITPQYRSLNNLIVSKHSSARPPKRHPRPHKSRHQIKTHIHYRSLDPLSIATGAMVTPPPATPYHSNTPKGRQQAPQARNATLVRITPHVSPAEERSRRPSRQQPRSVPLPPGRSEAPQAERWSNASVLRPRNCRAATQDKARQQHRGRGKRARAAVRRGGGAKKRSSRRRINHRIHRKKNTPASRQGGSLQENRHAG